MSFSENSRKWSLVSYTFLHLKYPTCLYFKHTSHVHSSCITISSFLLHPPGCPTVLRSSSCPVLISHRPFPCSDSPCFSPVPIGTTSEKLTNCDTFKAALGVEALCSKSTKVHILSFPWIRLFLDNRWVDLMKGLWLHTHFLQSSIIIFPIQANMWGAVWTSGVGHAPHDCHTRPVTHTEQLSRSTDVCSRYGMGIRLIWAM